ncbi:transmembrane protein 236-like [Acipenser ruthenus]|uniref:transmembrane protein 236-like n=1 Tax=Acipenser ruthenus TaxID=7906 RepID=UPI00145AE6F6|nr:transmembrane protein 236-like [Acipenser ruthenus]
MASGKKFKCALFEILQFSALCIPVFIIIHRFASIVKQVKKAQGQNDGDANTAYWLVVASSIAYVTFVALIIWVPMKYMIAKKRKFFTERKKWRPILLVYMILSTLPCFAFLIASTEVQVNSNLELHLYDTLTDLPVSLVMFSLICVDVIDRLRKCRLTGQMQEAERDAGIHSPVLTHLEQVPTVSGQIDENENENHGATRLKANGSVPGITAPENWENRYSSRTASSSYYTTQYTPSGRLKFLSTNDARAEMFVDCFVFWFDTIELVRVAGLPQVFRSGWVFPIYIFSYISLLRLIVKPKNPIRSSLGVFVQDIPFLFLRIGLITVFGYVTPLIYLFKNILVFLAFVYFNFVTKLKLFNTERMF